MEPISGPLSAPRSVALTLRRTCVSQKPECVIGTHASVPCARARGL